MMTMMMINGWGFNIPECFLCNSKSSRMSHHKPAAIVMHHPALATLQTDLPHPVPCVQVHQQGNLLALHLRFQLHW